MKNSNIFFLYLILVSIALASCDKWDMERNNPYDGNERNTAVKWGEMQITDEDDNDGELTGGESFEFAIRYTNTGNKNIDVLTITPAPDKNRLSVQEDKITQAGLKVGGVYDAVFHGTILLRPGAEAKIPCYININADGVTWQDTVYFTVAKGRLYFDVSAQLDYPYEESSGKFISTVTVSIINNGSVVSGLHGIMRPSDGKSGIQNGNDKLNFGTLQRGQSSDETNPTDKRIMIYVSPNTQYGTEVYYYIDLEDEAGRTLTTVVSIPLI